LEKLKVVSLFSGMGGMDLGVLGNFHYNNKYYEENPYEIVFASDNDKYSAKLYDENFGHKCHIEDIRKIKIKDIPSHDLLIGGFPCKSFSIVAQNPPRLGYDDKDGKLFYEMVKIIKKKKPRFFIAENVKGLISANKGQAFPLIIKSFEDIGYKCKYDILTASKYNVPQKRQRVFIVGFKYVKDKNAFSFPKPLQKNGPVLGDVVDINKNVDKKYFFSEKAVKGMLRVREKMNKGRVMDPQKPCNTISSHLAKVSLNGTDPVLFVNDNYRRFTPREAADIQSFPKNTKLDGVSEHRQYVAIGNAVPPVLMWYLIQSLNRIVG
jgi:DNA (cytosine-5)-methyltransferase 1